jgi:hypothetical protein
VRLYETTAVVTGRTRMKGRLGDAPFAASSRHTHVFVMQQGEWRLVAAQGTQIPTSPEQQAAQTRAVRWREEVTSPKEELHEQPD